MMIVNSCCPQLTTYTPTSCNNVRKPPQILFVEKGYILQENQSATAPKDIPLVTSELFSCRAIAILGENSNWMAHIFEWPSTGQAHTKESMQKMLDTAAEMLGIQPVELPSCKVFIVCGSDPCDEIDEPLKSALSMYNINAEWFDGSDSTSPIYALAYQDEVGTANGDITEYHQTKEINSRQI
ncbi:hypothetical protein LWV75_004677 [Salmonella enterica]|nr:hypothetical protein [Salmonella enterica]ELP3961659.1 hypothetical protein [Escherichia coli]EIN9757201.1 hypothetical protein [Salmonella enterica]EIR3175073.1 hypothetical protein [Salmonella enterica]EJD1203590.1 hypothetical protein [Salmonella enterica]